MSPTEANEILAQAEGWEKGAPGMNISPSRFGMWHHKSKKRNHWRETPPTYHRPEDAANLIRVLGGLSEEQKRELWFLIHGLYARACPRGEQYPLIGYAEWCAINLWCYHLDSLTILVAEVVDE